MYGRSKQPDADPHIKTVVPDFEKFSILVGYLQPVEFKIVELHLFPRYLAAEIKNSNMPTSSEQ